MIFCKLTVPWWAGWTKEQSVSYFVYWVMIELWLFQSADGDVRFNEPSLLKSLSQWISLIQNDILCKIIVPQRAGQTKEQSLSYFVYWVMIELRLFQSADGDGKLNEPSLLKSLSQWISLSQNNILRKLIVPWWAGRTKEQSVSYFVYWVIIELRLFQSADGDERFNEPFSLKYLLQWISLNKNNIWAIWPNK